MKYVFFILIALSITTASCAQDAEPWPWVSNDADLSIMIFGDTNIQSRDNPIDGFRYVLPTINEVDFRICNLEGPLAGTSSDPMLPDIPHKERWKHSDPEMVKGLVKAHFDAVSVANNVTWPWMALMKSLKVLDANGIQHAGGGKNIDAAHDPVILEKNGTRIGLLAYANTVFPFQHAATDSTPGIATVRVDTYYKAPPNLDKPGMPPTVVTIPVEHEFERMKDDIAALSEQVDIIIVSYHWGISRHTELIDYQVEIAHAAIEAGADVIMGHGNHLIGAIEVYKNKPIFYGLGNLVFDWEKMRTRKNGITAKLDIDNKELKSVSVLPIKRDDNNIPHFLDPNSGDGAELFEIIQSRSGSLSTLTIQGKEIRVELE